MTQWLNNNKVGFCLLRMLLQALDCFCYASEVKVAQSCPPLCDPMDYTAHGILQARIQERVTFPFSRGSSQLRDQTQVSRIAGRFFTSGAMREANRTGGDCQRPITGFKILCRETYLSCPQQSLYLMKS